MDVAAGVCWTNDELLEYVYQPKEAGGAKTRVNGQTRVMAITRLDKESHRGQRLTFYLVFTSCKIIMLIEGVALELTRSEAVHSTH